MYYNVCSIDRSTQIHSIHHTFSSCSHCQSQSRVLQEMKIQFGLARDAHRDILFENFEEVPSFPEREQL